jgi:NADH-ubiquinone oxidoreductase chain 5
MTLVMFITTLVKIYSLDYKGEDPHLARFKSYLGLFSFSKLLLLLADNLIVLFLGWEMVGVVSYLLVNFWFTRIKANQSALKALFKNKVGDAALVVGAVIITKLVGDVQYSTIFSLSHLLDQPVLMWALIALIVAGGAKSALIGLHSWLPSAKEGPTPVSA